MTDREPQSLDFGVAAVLLIGIYVVSELVDASRVGRLLTAVLVYLAAFVVMRGIRASRAATRGVIVVLSVASGLRLATVSVDSTVLNALASALHVGIAVAAPIMVLRFILASPTVTGNVVFAGVTLYLLVGILFGIVYTDVAWLEPTAFAPAQEVARAGESELFYFSFITLTTVGFGDIGPAADLTRALVVIEALTGQIVLVVLIARLVGAAESLRSASG